MKIILTKSSNLGKDRGGQKYLKWFKHGSSDSSKGAKGKIGIKVKKYQMTKTMHAKEKASGLGRLLVGDITVNHLHIVKKRWSLRLKKTI